jgi:hypothetical protein
VFDSRTAPFWLCAVGQGEVAVLTGPGTDERALLRSAIRRGNRRLPGAVPFLFAL